MLLATGHSRFADLIERTLYNAVLSGVSLDGERYFYVNPLASNGAPEHLSRGGCRRKEWHLVACCPPNVMRLFASLGQYVATRDASGLQIHQYMPARIVTNLEAGRPTALRMETEYPWEGRVRLTVEETSGATWPLHVRIPGWAQGIDVSVNGSPAPALLRRSGYLRLEREWKSGDTVDIELAMESRLVEAHPHVESARGCVAIERGPLVYCIEGADHPGREVLDLQIDTKAPLTARRDNKLLDGITIVQASGFQVDVSSWRGQLSRPHRDGSSLPRQPADLIAIPYYAWANREPGAMRVWIPAI
jgi:DUF1680 family protein